MMRLPDRRGVVQIGGGVELAGPTSAMARLQAPGSGHDAPQPVALGRRQLERHVDLYVFRADKPRFPRMKGQAVFGASPMSRCPVFEFLC